jgi:hypothetical protein
MAQLGSNRITSAQSTNGVSDISGVPLVSTFNDFGDSPLGIAARSQALYGIANAQFNLLPQNQDDEIVDYQNPLPYWSCENYSNGRIVPKSFYDTTTGTWSVELNPTAGSAADYLELKTRSFLLTDDNLALRQKAYLTMSKGTAYAGATQFNVVLSAEYFDVNGASLSTYAIGTALDNTAMTSITGITTSGSAAISAAASYVDFTIKLTATATVTSGVKVYLKSFFIQTSQASTGSFLITETLTASETYTPPTGVTNFVAVVAGGAGGGGGGGGGVRGTLPISAGGGGGGGAGWTLIRDVSLGTATSVTIGIGAGGTGGTAMAFSVTAGSGTVTVGTAVGGAGASGGATTVTIAGNALVTVPGGGGGGGGSARARGTVNVGTAAGGTAGGAGAAVTFTYFGGTGILGGSGAIGGSVSQSSDFVATTAGTGLGLGFAAYPYSTFTAGGTGGDGSFPAGTAGFNQIGTSVGKAGGSAHFGGGGGGGGAIRLTSTNTSNTDGTASPGAAGGAGGGGGAAGGQLASSTGTATVQGGNGGAAGTLSTAGGGGGGGVYVRTNGGDTGWTLTVNAGTGGYGSGGFVTLVYVA